MDYGIRQRRQNAGGIIGLAKYLLEHRKAIEYDLLTKTGHEFNDIGRTLTWDALDSFLSNIGPDSALARETYPEIDAWGTTLKTNIILTDIWNVLAMINANLIAIGMKKPAKAPKPYPRPGQKAPEDETKIGSGALPPGELRKWFEEKREQHARSSTGDNNSHSSDGRSPGENNK